MNDICGCQYPTHLPPRTWHKLIGVGVREHVIQPVSFWGYRACVDSLARGGVEDDEAVCRGVEKVRLMDGGVLRGLLTRLYGCPSAYLLVVSVSVSSY